MPPAFSWRGNRRRMIFASERGRDLISESVQVINRQSALLATGQMIGDHLQIFAGQDSIDISGRLFRAQMRAYEVRRRNLCRLAKKVASEGEECRVAVHRRFGLPPACLTLAQVIRHRQQFRDG
jgi:hypothetical protein